MSREETPSPPPIDDHKSPLGTPFLQVVLGGILQQALYIVTKLGVADLLAERPQTANELADKTQVHAGALYRILRTLAGSGIFAEKDDGTFIFTPPAALLRPDIPGSLHNLIIFGGEKWHWDVYANMLYSVQTGNAAWKQTHGLDIFPWLIAHPEHLEVFNRAMSGVSFPAASAVVEAYDFSSVKSIIDIGGGQGQTLTCILKANPHLKGVLFELPQVIAEASDAIERQGLAGRIELTAGDLFDSIPSGMDVYLIKHVLHNWNDEHALQILRNIHQAMPPHGKLLLIEMVVPAGNQPHISKLLDLGMLISFGGAERSALEYERLFSQTALRLTRIIPTQSPLDNIIEAVKHDT